MNIDFFAYESITTKGGKLALIVPAGTVNVGDAVVKQGAVKLDTFRVTGLGKSFSKTSKGGWIDEEDARSFGGTGQMIRIQGGKAQDMQYAYIEAVA